MPGTKPTNACERSESVPHNCSQGSTNNSGTQTHLPLALPRSRLSQSDGLSALIHAIEQEVVPALLRSQGLEADGPRVSPGSVRDDSLDTANPTALDVGLPSAQQVSDFASTLLLSEAQARLSVEAWLNQGLPLQSVWLHLVSPAAQLLGDWWLDDQCDFTDVTVALARMQSIVQHPPEAWLGTTAGTRQQASSRRLSGRVLLSLVPGEQHSLGLTIVHDFFCRGGWDVWENSPLGEDQLVSLAARQGFDVVGFSIANEANLDCLMRLVRRVRQVTSRDVTRILVGGPLFREQPQLVTAVHADGVASDARIAMVMSEKWLLQRIDRKWVQAN